MKSAIVSASIFAIAALAAGSSFAEGRDPSSLDSGTFVSTKTRADVKAELLQAQRAGYNVNIGKNYTGDQSASTSTKTRAEVRSETIGSIVSTNTLERAYPVIR